MASIQLTDLVLLQSAFEMWPGDPDPADAEEHEDRFFAYPEGDFLQLSTSSERESENEIVLYVHAGLDDPALPFRLEVVLGARYHIGESEEELPAERAEATLMWMCYPYLGELVATITGRSPLPPYYLPALTRLPDPSVLVGASPSGESPAETPETPAE